MCQQGVIMELTYFDILGKSTDEGTRQDSKTASPFVVCKVGDDVNTLPELRGSLKSFEAVQGNCKDKDGGFYQRQKPVELYAELIALLGQTHTWTMDVCSGAGSAALASIESSCNVVVVEYKEERCRMIKRRLQLNATSESGNT